MKFRVIPLVFILGLLLSCADVPVKPITPFQLQERDYLYDKDTWTFSGRIALSNEKESLSLSISWKHFAGRDEIELAGPFGQGRTFVEITEDRVDIDYGDKRIHFAGNVDNLVSKHTGVNVPISALKYWVLGLVKPDTRFVSKENGFLQSEWHVQYQQMQFVEGDELPKKIKVERIESRDERLKLIIDRWDIWV